MPLCPYIFPRIRRSIFSSKWCWSRGHHLHLQLFTCTTGKWRYSEIINQSKVLFFVVWKKVLDECDHFYYHFSLQQNKDWGTQYQGFNSHFQNNQCKNFQKKCLFIDFTLKSCHYSYQGNRTREVNSWTSFFQYPRFSVFQYPKDLCHGGCQMCRTRAEYPNLPAHDHKAVAN